VSANVEAVETIFEAWNRGDFEGVIAGTAEDFEWIPVTVSTIEGETAFRGREGFRRFFEQWGNTWETWDVQLQECRELGDRVVALGRVHARGRGSGVELDQPAAYVFDFRGGELARGESFFDQDEALAAAGVAESREKSG
jgi:ketosteroid isomerase-like protein